ncbi:potassium channel family protein [Natronorubrum bangense]|uniref:Kef-type K+ transporter NAD-binding component n=2 Tax=Natronorubrum bangense TaxID=61858 RepID=L9WWH8_9EURY|nr:potassium channel protein [Natronorubrum bangense]ELY52698.1 Kef-type K+ transporter NAD-binding component [Natronorubrum bangense JCM 10635]QCC55152.1 TrkA family potassium uptake protein [Natronorubrum bangense]
MNTWWRRIGLSLVAVFGVMVLYSLLYQWAMMAFEGEHRTLFQSAQTVIEILTTAGFGGDADDWTTAPMTAIVIGMNLTGVLLVFLALPLVVVPLFQQALARQPAESTELTDHVIICSHTEREDVLRNELEAADVPYVFIEDDPETVLELTDDGIETMLGNPEQEQTLRAANIDDARAIVIDVSDEANPEVILTARELRDDIKIVSVAEDDEVATYHRYAGADAIVRPRQVLGHSLAQKAALSVTEELKETIELGEQLEITELLVEDRSDIAGQTIAESGIRERMGINVIGLWMDGEFEPVPDPETVVEENTILLVAGQYDALTELTSRTVSPSATRSQRVIVGGYGEVGRTVSEGLADAAVPQTVVDKEASDGVDVVGDITDEATLSAIDCTDARSIVLALDDDTTAIYATLVLEAVAPDIEVLVRANETEAVRKLYRAGAEYVLSLSTVAGRMLSSVLLEDEEILAPETQFEIIRTMAPEFVGRSLEELDIRAQLGCTVVAVERNGDLITNPGASFVVQEHDELIVAGSDESVNRFISSNR